MRTVMKTHLCFIGTVALLGTSLLTMSYAANTSEYLHLTRHRDSNGNLLMAPRQHQAEPSVMQKMAMPSQLKTFERRSTDWGMSVQEVKENEPVQSSWDLQAPVLGDYEKRVAYHTQIEGIAAALTYTFYDNHLGQAKYVFEPQHEDAVEYVQDFHTVKSWISHSYGSPVFVQEIWLDTLYQYDQSLWGQAVKRGHLVMVAEWKNPGTDIVLVLDGGNDEVGLIADFASTTFVVPVSLDLQGQEESVEEVIEETTAHEAVLPTEENAGLMTEEMSVQDLSLEHEGNAKYQPETAVASQGSVSEIDELEQMLNKEFPLNETVNKEFPLTEPLNKAFPLHESVEPAMESGLDSGIHDAVSKETAVEAVPDTHASVNSEEIDHASMLEHPMGEQHLLGEGMSQSHLIEPSVDAQMSENTMETSEVMPLEPSSAEQPMEAHPTDDHADAHAMDEHANDHVMEVETELEPQHL